MMFFQRAAHPLSYGTLHYSRDEFSSKSWGQGRLSSASWTGSSKSSVSWRHNVTSSSLWGREMIIARALETEEGRNALAAAMVEPIRRRLNEKGLGRFFFGLEPRNFAYDIGLQPAVA